MSFLDGDVARAAAARRTVDCDHDGVEVRGRKSAMPLGAGNVVRSMTRNRNRVTLPPVLFDDGSANIQRSER